MIPAQYRLPLRQMKDFFQHAIKKRYSTFLLYSLPSSGKCVRCALSIKSEGTTAVERNRIKRVIRPILFSHLQTLPHKDIVFAIHSLNEKKITQDLQQCLQELELKQ